MSGRRSMEQPQPQPHNLNRSPGQTPTSPAFPHSRLPPQLQSSGGVVAGSYGRDRDHRYSDPRSRPLRPLSPLSSRAHVSSTDSNASTHPNTYTYPNTTTIPIPISTPTPTSPATTYSSVPGSTTAPPPSLDGFPYIPADLEHDLLPPPNFKPIFTLVRDQTTGVFYRPAVHYLFSDDDPELAVAASLRSIGVEHLFPATDNLTEENNLYDDDDDDDDDSGLGGGRGGANGDGHDRDDSREDIDGDNDSRRDGGNGTDTDNCDDIRNGSSRGHGSRSDDSIGDRRNILPGRRRDRSMDLSPTYSRHESDNSTGSNRNHRSKPINKQRPPDTTSSHPSSNKPLRNGGTKQQSLSSPVITAAAATTPSPLPHARPGVKEVYIILDVGPDGKTVERARSLSANWALTTTSVGPAPILASGSGTHNNNTNNHNSHNHTNGSNSGVGLGLGGRDAGAGFNSDTDGDPESNYSPDAPWVSHHMITIHGTSVGAFAGSALLGGILPNSGIGNNANNNNNFSSNTNSAANAATAGEFSLSTPTFGMNATRILDAALLVATDHSSTTTAAAAAGPSSRTDHSHNRDHNTSRDHNHGRENRDKDRIGRNHIAAVTAISNRMKEQLKVLEVVAESIRFPPPSFRGGHGLDEEYQIDHS